MPGAAERVGMRLAHEARADEADVEGPGHARLATLAKVERIWDRARVDSRTGRGDNRILLGLDDEPAAVARGAHETGERGEVDGAVAGDGEHATAYRVVEAVVAGADGRHLLGAHVLQVDVDDSVAEAVDEARVVESGRDGMAGIEEQAQFRARPGR